MTETDKMISRKDGRVGYVIYNNPERHNAVSLDMWEAAVHILDDFRADNEIGVVVGTGAAARPSSRAPTFRVSRRSAPAKRRWRAIIRLWKKATRHSTNFPNRPSR